MSNPIVPTYEPNFYKNFQCIGGDCEDSCCAGWNVFLDKKTYDKYKALDEPTLNERFEKQLVEVNEDEGEDEEYSTVAKIKMDDHHNCPFWNKQGLCDIQLTVGEDYLSNTCTIYPRQVAFFIDSLSWSLMLSCPEAARTILYQDKLVFDCEDKEAPPLYQVAKHLEVDDDNQYFHDIQGFLIEILQCRDYTLETRLFAAAYFCKNLDERPEKINRWISKVCAMLDDGSFDEQFTNLETNVAVSINMIHSFIEGFQLNGAYRLVECLNSYQEGLGNENPLENFQKAARDIFDPFVEENPNFLENYCVHYIYTQGLPYHGSMDSFTNFCRLIVHYCIIKTMCIGMAADQGELNKEMIVKTVQSFTKIVDHNNKNVNSFMDQLKANNGLNLAHMAVLLKHQ